MLKLWCPVLLVLLSCGCEHVSSQNSECPPDDADTEGLAELLIFQTATADTYFYMDEIQEDMNNNTSPEIQTMAESQEKLQKDSENGVESLEYQREKPSSEDYAGTVAYNEYQYYTHLCPYRYYWLRRFSWYFYSYNSTLRKYCFSFYPIFVTSCANRYCNVGYRNPFYFYHYYRCFPEYSYIWMYAICYQYRITDGFRTVTKEYIRRAVPRGCCCRKYYNKKALEQKCILDEQQWGRGGSP